MASRAAGSSRHLVPRRALESTVWWAPAATDSLVDPSTFDPKVVLVTPYNGATWVAQTDYGNPYVMLRYNVLGLIPTGGAVKFDLYDSTTNTHTYYTQPIDDGVLWVRQSAITR